MSIRALFFFGSRLNPPACKGPGRKKKLSCSVSVPDTRKFVKMRPKKNSLSTERNAVSPLYRAHVPANHLGTANMATPHSGSISSYGLVDKISRCQSRVPGSIPSGGIFFLFLARCASGNVIADTRRKCHYCICLTRM